MAQLWTIGTSNRSIEEFLAILKKHEIEVIVDVRRFPMSKFEHFNGNYIKAYLKEVGIEYFHVTELTGYRKEGYKEHMKSEEFAKGLLFVENLASSKRVAIMCAEKLFFRCHRRYIADALKQRSYRVLHIIDEKRSHEHKTLRDFALTKFLLLFS